MRCDRSGFRHLDLIAFKDIALRIGKIVTQWLVEFWDRSRLSLAKLPDSDSLRSLTSSQDGIVHPGISINKFIKVTNDIISTIILFSKFEF